MKKSVSQDLQKLGVSPSKARGQNFLTDPGAVREVLNFADVLPTDTVVEVGPGLGAITYELDLRCSRLVLIEVEKEFSRTLSEKLGVKVIESDVRNVSLKEHFSSPIVVVSNVPYSISTDFCFWLFREHRLLRSASLLLQREFAERLGASEGSRAYGSLSVLRSIYCSAELGPVIRPEAFFPPPKVDSQLVRLNFDSPVITLGEMPQEEFERFVRAAFSQKRKTLSNSLGSSSIFENKKDATMFLDNLALSPTARAEELSPSEYLRLAKAWHALKGV